MDRVKQWYLCVGGKIWLMATILEKKDNLVDDQTIDKIYIDINYKLRLL